MKLANMLKDRVTIRVKSATQTAMGETVVWIPVESRSCRVIQLDAKARAVYQQLKSEVTHKIVFMGNVNLSLGNNRILWKDKTLELVGPTSKIADSTVVMVKEI